MKQFYPITDFHRGINTKHGDTHVLKSRKIKTNSISDSLGRGQKPTSDYILHEYETDIQKVDQFESSLIVAKNVMVDKVGQIRSRGVFNDLANSNTGTMRDYTQYKNNGTCYFKSDFDKDGNDGLTEYLVLDTDFGGGTGKVEFFYWDGNSWELTGWGSVYSSGKMPINVSSSYNSGILRVCAYYSDGTILDKVIYRDSVTTDWEIRDRAFPTSVSGLSVVAIPETEMATELYNMDGYKIYASYELDDKQETGLYEVDSVEINNDNKIQAYNLVVSSIPTRAKYIKWYIYSPQTDEYHYLEKSSSTISAIEITSLDPNTFSVNSGFEVDVVNDEYINIDGYMDIQFANGRAFAISPIIDGVVYNDRIVYSEINKFDTFLPYNFVDVSINDGDVYVAIKEFGSRLFAFKSDKLEIINIKEPSPAGWYLEDTLTNHGVSHARVPISTPYGLVWANSNGCYFYDGSKLNELSIQIDDDDWDTYFWSTFGGIGFIPDKNQLIIIQDLTSPTLGAIYDFNTKSWVECTGLLDDEIASPPLLISNDSLQISIGGTNNGIYEWQDEYTLATSYTVSHEVETKRIDFQLPVNTKRVYGIYVKGENVDDLTVTAYADSTPLATTGIGNSLVRHFTHTATSVGRYYLNITSSGSRIVINDIQIEFRPIRQRI